MDPSFWQQRWSTGQIGFHEGRPNTYLERHAERLANCPRVLVPMCGKTEDLAFLASRGHEVIGLELVEDAVRAFFTEHGRTPVVTPRGPLVEYASPPITVFAGDLFSATHALLGTIDGIYDRGALVALPDDMRRRYVDHLRALVGKGGRVLLVAFEYDQSQKQGPPFSVTEAELRVLFDGTHLELLSEGPDPAEREGWPPRFERCWAITL